MHSKTPAERALGLEIDMTWLVETAVLDVWDELNKAPMTQAAVTQVIARHLQAAYDAGRRDSDEANEQAAFDKFVASLKPGDPDEGLPTIDEVRGILKISPEEAYLCAQAGGHRYGTNGRCIWCDAEQGG